ncbi:MAG: hypothetical protein IJ412_04510 [Oscillospiraceae bacterium]|nr:hypothetical protein [Oscillospiraceae bacterium]
MKLKIKEIAIFGMLGALMYISKMVMEFLPNIHLVGVLTMAYTLVYRKKALYPLYVFVILIGLLNGFNTWWIPYLYIWTLLWAVTMLLPKNMPKKLAPFVYMAVCSLHGFLYGTLYAPAQALFFGLDWQGTVAWIIAGLPYDVIHGVSNFIAGTLIVPMVSILRLAEKATRKT